MTTNAMKNELELFKQNNDNAKIVIDNIKTEINDLEEQISILKKKAHLFKVLNLINVMEKLKDSEIIKKLNIVEIEMYYEHSRMSDSNDYIIMYEYCSDNQSYGHYKLQNNTSKLPIEEIENFRKAVFELYTELESEDINSQFLLHQKIRVSLERPDKLLDLFVSEKLKNQYRTEQKILAYEKLQETIVQKDSSVVKHKI